MTSVNELMSKIYGTHTRPIWPALNGNNDRDKLIKHLSTGHKGRELADYIMLLIELNDDDDRT